MSGQIRVGRIVDQKNPMFKGFENIVVMMKSHSPWYSLSPYSLNKDGCIMENMWQFQKVYPTVPKSIQKYSRYNDTVIWEWPEEDHIIDEVIQPAYWIWREAGFNNKFAVRYPVGYKYKHTVKYAITQQGGIPLNYIEARKAIYLPLYMELAEKEERFRQLKTMYEKGVNLLIIEVDGPHQESLNYYKEKYQVDDSFIKNHTILATQENLNIMLNDSKYAFGHGYCLAALIQGFQLS